VIADIDFFHGVVFSRMIGEKASRFEKIETNNSSYIIDERIPIYIKYSQKRISPWIFTFTEAHIEEIKKVQNGFKEVFILLVCNNNGVCCLNYQEFSTVISTESNYFPKWIKAQRQKGEKYAVTGSDGKLTHKIGDSDFPRKIQLS
jgi:hypothetical protein